MALTGSLHRDYYTTKLSYKGRLLATETPSKGETKEESIVPRSPPPQKKRREREKGGCGVAQWGCGVAQWGCGEAQLGVRRSSVGVRRSSVVSTLDC